MLLCRNGRESASCDGDTRTGKKEFPSIKFTQPGIYQYEITQQKGSTKYYTYDPCVYNVTVYCTADASKELEITVVAFEGGSGDKKRVGSLSQSI